MVSDVSLLTYRLNTGGGTVILVLVAGPGVAGRGVVVSTLWSTVHGGAVDSCRAVSAVPAAMELRWAHAGPFPGTYYAGCGPARFARI